MVKFWFLAFNLSSVVLLARAIGYEAPTAWAKQDQPLVAACVRCRMMILDLSVQDVLFQPGQFSVAHKLDQNPPGEDMTRLIRLALDVLTSDDLVPVSHFYSPKYLSDPPSWARDEWSVSTPGAVQRYYLLPGWECDENDRN